MAGHSNGIHSIYPLIKSILRILLDSFRNANSPPSQLSPWTRRWSNTIVRSFLYSTLLCSALLYNGRLLPAKFHFQYEKKKPFTLLAISYLMFHFKNHPNPHSFLPPPLESLFFPATDSLAPQLLSKKKTINLSQR